MSVLESLQQFFRAGVDVLKSLYLVLEPNLGLYLGLAVWILFWVGAVNWVRLRKVLLSGGWVGVALIAFLAIVVWACIAPPANGSHSILGLTLSNLVGKTVYVTGLICIMFICGSIRLASASIEEDAELTVTMDSH